MVDPKEQLVKAAMTQLQRTYAEIAKRKLGTFTDKDLIQAADRMGSNLFRLHQMFPSGFGPRNLKELAKIIHTFIGDDEDKLDKLVAFIEQEQTKRDVDRVSREAEKLLTESGKAD